MAGSKEAPLWARLRTCSSSREQATAGARLAVGSSGRNTEGSSISTPLSLPAGLAGIVASRGKTVI